jgi:hypothetical protein
MCAKMALTTLEKKYTIVETNEKYTIEEYHVVRLSKALKEGLQ